ncbi:MAG: transposase, partial [Candidatus Omnitrophica bacterium]|nr:transposase [Candidatus Omnitrophota bacterium]
FKYYQIKEPPYKFNYFVKIKTKENFDEDFSLYLSDKEKIVEIVAYCIMPTHFHLILKQLKKGGISTFIGNVLNSYSRYFNTKHKRGGPLWEGKFKNVSVETDEQLLHLTRYIHLNPTSAGLVKKPEEWSYSSYLEYLGKIKKINRICSYEDSIDISPLSYKNFVESRILYQRELEKIKHLILE